MDAGSAIRICLCLNRVLKNVLIFPFWGLLQSLGTVTLTALGRALAYGNQEGHAAEDTAASFTQMVIASLRSVLYSAAVISWRGKWNRLVIGS